EEPHEKQERQRVVAQTIVRIAPPSPDHLDLRISRRHDSTYCRRKGPSRRRARPAGESHATLCSTPTSDERWACAHRIQEPESRSGRAFLFWILAPGFSSRSAPAPGTSSRPRRG